MITDIKIVPRAAIEYMVQYPDEIMLCGRPWHLVSIYTEPDAEILVPAVEASFRALDMRSSLSLRFSDIVHLDHFEDNRERYPVYTNLFDAKLANKILDFLAPLAADRSPDPGLLICHCDAGISRSGAVGLFACELLGLDEGRFRARNRNIMPNPHVVRILREQHALRSGSTPG